MKHLFILAILVFGLHAEYVTKLKKACDLNDREACADLGYFYYIGKGVKKDYITAKKYYQKACKLKNSKGCKWYEYLKRKGY